MCGRFVSASPPDEIASYFGVEAMSEQVLEPSYNVAPTDDVYVVYSDGGMRRLDPFHWGLVPRWAKDMSIGNRMINARAESVATNNAFKSSFAKRRCFLPVDGFYEWKVVEGQKKKQPYFIHHPDGEPFALGGLWAEWRGKDRNGEEITLRSTTIITGEPNEKMAELHDRMPLILPPDQWDRWLDPEFDDVDALGKLLVPAPSSLIAFHPVSTEVNNVRNSGPQLMEEVPPDTLF
ncbi:MAG TPA: SOS response-associated peptidase [Microthrixaceae bacterium]|nr:SOS response-associated peptidase [Microthrixaceae bacterium]